MKRNQQTVSLFVMALIALVAFYVQSRAQAPLPAPPGTTVSVFFSPNGGCTEAVVREIAAARRSVKIQAYSFTSRDIAEALMKAIKRGVKVQALLDSSNQEGDNEDRYNAGVFLHNAGAEVWTDARHAIAHNKIMLIDEATIITGSFNFTNAAEKRNAENLLVIKAFPDLTRKYLANWDEHRGHSQPFRLPRSAPPGSGEQRPRRGGR